jgi:Spy/CpxP family protein refolding chaperone
MQHDKITNMKINRWLAVASMAATCFGAVSVMAQPGGGGGFGGGGMGGMGGMGGGGFGGMMGGMSMEDRQAVNAAIQTNTAYSKLRTDLQTAQTAAVEAALAKDAKDADVKAKIEAVNKLQAEMALAYWQVVKQVVKFTDEQKTQLKDTSNPMSMGYMTLFGGGGGRGGFGGGMGGMGGGMGGMGGGGFGGPGGGGPGGPPQN